MALENVAQTTYEELHPLFQKTSRFLASLFGRQVPVNLAVDNKITPPLTPPQKEGVKEVVVISPRQVIQEITKNISYAGISREEFENRLQDIATKFFSETSRLSTATSNNSTYINNVYNTVAGTNDIDMLHNVDISDSSTFTNGAITNSTITNSPISGSTGSFTTLSSDTLSATDATITNSVITNATTTNFFTSAINAVSSIFSSITGGSATIGSLTATSSATLSYTGANMLITTDGTGKLVSSSTPTAAYYLATSTFASVFPYASSTALTISGTNGFQLATGLNGPLQANAGLVSATTSIGIFYGGTNATTFSDNALVQFDGIRLISVSSPTIGSLISTTTATSSFAGGVQVDGHFTSGTNKGVVFNTNATANSLVVSSAGHVGIGTTSPWARFSVAGASLGATPLFAISSSTASATSTAFVIDSNGKVGVGTSTPGTDFAVQGGVLISGITNLMGHCVTGDTKLRRRRKRKSKGLNLEDEYEYDEVAIKDVEAGDEIQTLDQKTGALVWSKIKGVAFMGTKPIFKLTTASGKTDRKSVV